jgi:hypothetical protein
MCSQERKGMYLEEVEDLGFRRSLTTHGPGNQSRIDQVGGRVASFYLKFLKVTIWIVVSS